ncbi:MAG: acylphosphatase [Parachlamydiales bacterium]
MLELTAIAHGYVQGVFFRRTVFQHASAFGLAGTVRNLPDGTVEIVAQGDEQTLKAFLEALRANPGSARLLKLETRYSAPKRRHSGFEILYR